MTIQGKQWYFLRFCNIGYTFADQFSRCWTLPKKLPFINHLKCFERHDSNLHIFSYLTWLSAPSISTLSTFLVRCGIETNIDEKHSYKEEIQILLVMQKISITDMYWNINRKDLFAPYVLFLFWIKNWPYLQITVSLLCFWLIHVIETGLLLRICTVCLQILKRIIMRLSAISVQIYFLASAV